MNSVFIKALCFLPLAICSEPRDWSFVQSVGGIALGSSSFQEGSWSLSIRVNVSGLEQITAKPTLQNSDLACTRTEARVKGDAIYITIDTGLIREGYSAACPSAALGNVPGGRYKVFYKSPGGELQPMGAIVLDFN